MEIMQLEEVVRRYVVGVVRAYLERRCDLKWAVRCIDRSGKWPAQIRAIISHHRDWGDPNRWQVLAEAYETRDASTRSLGADDFA